MEREKDVDYVIEFMFYLILIVTARRFDIIRQLLLDEQQCVTYG